jgi:hypothetical protein
MNDRRRWAVAIVSLTAVVMVACGMSSPLVLSGGTHAFTVTWIDGTTTSAFHGTSGSTQFSGASGPGPSFSSTQTFIATETFAGQDFNVAITLAPSTNGKIGPVLFQVSGKFGSMSVHGTAQPNTNRKTFKSQLAFRGTVGGTNVSGMLPLPAGYEGRYSTTGTIDIG